MVDYGVGATGAMPACVIIRNGLLNWVAWGSR